MAKLPPRSQRRGEGAYKTARASAAGVRFIPSGAAVMDCAGAGGREEPGCWPLGRMVNIIGDKSTGKTLLAMEACANFLRYFPKGKVWYRESEAAFDKDYAENGLGLSLKKVHFWEDDYGEDAEFKTVEDMFEDLDKILDTNPECGLYIVDSLDALSDRASEKLKVDEGSYSMTKQKQIGKLFTRLIRKLKKSKICFVIISQVRVDINAMFGQKLRRNGGKALDFYASYCVWLAHIKRLTRTVHGVERAYGIRVRAQFNKNKIAKPFRECEFDILFDYGIDDLGASLDWLASIKQINQVLGVKDKAEFLTSLRAANDDEFRQATSDVATIVREKWREVDASFAPTRRKYAEVA